MSWKPGVLVSAPCGPECVASQVLATCRRHCEIILDADTAELAQRVDPFPVDAARALVGSGGLEKLRDEIEPRLHRHHEAFFQHTGQAEVRMTLRARDVATVR